MENKNKLSEFFYKAIDYYYILLPVLVFLLYFTSINYGFVKCDDYDLIITNHNLIDNIDKIPAQFHHSYMNSNYYRPMINLSFLANSLIGGTDPAYYHFFNIFFHSIAVILFFLFLLKIGFDKILSFLASIVFAVHPLFVNAVAWIPGRNDIILGIFLLLAFIFLIEYLNNDKLVYLIFHFFSFLFAVLSKETALLAPILFVLYFIQQKKFNKSKIIKLSSLWISAIIIWFILRSSASLGKSFNEFGINALIHNLTAIPEIISKTFIPLRISVLATYNNELFYIGLAIILIFGTLYFLMKTKNKTLILFGIIWFLIFIIPGMFVRRLNASDWNDYLECRTYVPVIGIFIMVLSFISKDWIKNKINIIIIIFLLLISTFITISIKEINNYKNPFTFYQSVYVTNPERAQFDYQFAKACLSKNDIDLAEKALKASIKANPNYGKYYYNLGVFYFNQKKFDKSEKYLKIAIIKDSLYKNSYLTLATLYQTTNQYKKARATLIQAYKSTDNIGFIQNLILNDIQKKNLSQLKEDIYQYKNILIGNTELLNTLIGLGVDSFDKGEKTIAENLWELALELDRNNYLALDNLFQYYLIEKKDFKSAKYYADRIESIGKTIDEEKKTYLKEMLTKTIGKQK